MKHFVKYLALTLSISLLLSAVSCRPSSSNNTTNTTTGGKVVFPKEDISLTYYRLWDDDSALDEAIKAYQQLHKNITITVRKISIPEDKTIYDYQNDVIKQIMIILFIGLLVDPIMTYIQNAGMLRMYLERKQK